MEITREQTIKQLAPILAEQNIYLIDAANTTDVADGVAELIKLLPDGGEAVIVNTFRNDDSEAAKRIIEALVEKHVSGTGGSIILRLLQSTDVSTRGQVVPPDDNR